MSFEEYMDQQLPTWRTTIPEEVQAYLKTMYDVAEENRKSIKRIVEAACESSKEEITELYNDLSNSESSKNKII